MWLPIDDDEHLKKLQRLKMLRRRVELLEHAERRCDGDLEKAILFLQRFTAFHPFVVRAERENLKAALAEFLDGNKP